MTEFVRGGVHKPRESFESRSFGASKQGRTLTMELTVIKVRGRKAVAATSKRLTACSNSNKSATRPLRNKLHPLAPTKKTKRTAEPIMETAKRQKDEEAHPPSTLESVPTEILQKIFLLSMNSNLPLASKILLKKVSAKPIFIKFALNALARTSPLSDSDEAPELQGRVLRSRFFTWPFLLDCYEKALDLFQAQNSEPVERHIRASAFFWTKLLRDRPSLAGMLRFDIETPIPNKILHGPWTHDKIRLLEHLYGLGLGVHPLNSTGIEIATSGLWDAVVANDLSLVYILTSDMVQAKPSKDMIRAALHAHPSHVRVIKMLLVHVPRGEMPEKEVWAWTEENLARNSKAALWLSAVVPRSNFDVQDTTQALLLFRGHSSMERATLIWNEALRCGAFGFSWATSKWEEVCLAGRRERRAVTSSCYWTGCNGRRGMGRRHQLTRASNHRRIKSRNLMH